MASKKSDQFNPWLNMDMASLNTEGNQMNPAVMGQLFSQASQPVDEAAQMLQAPEPPQLFTPAPQAPKMTAQPTTEEPGALPQELVPQQPAMMPQKMTSEDWMQKLMSYSGPSNKGLLAELDRGKQSYAERLMGQQAELDAMKTALAKYQQMDPGFDFRPLAAFVDSMFGGGGMYSKAAQSMAPASQEERAQKAFDLQQKIAAASGDLSRAELEGLKNTLAQMGYADQRAMQIEMAKIQAMGGFAKDNERYLDQREEARREKQTIDYTGHIGSQAIELSEQLRNLEEGLGFSIDDVDTKTGYVAGRKVDIPGFSLPGVGRVAVTDAAADIESRFSPIFNTTLRNRSGMAVTTPELERLKNEFAKGKFNTEEKLLAATKRFKIAAAKKLAQEEAGYVPEIKTRVREQGGQTVEDLFGSVLRPGGLDAKRKRLEELRKKAGK